MHFVIRLKDNTFVVLAVMVLHGCCRFVFIVRLKLHGHMRITEVSEAFMLTPGAATNMCDKLEDLNYIERIRIKTDRRVVNVALTTRGEKRVEEIFSKLPLEKLVAISTTLAEINHLFEKIIDESCPKTDRFTICFFYFVEKGLTINTQQHIL